MAIDSSWTTFGWKQGAVLLGVLLLLFVAFGRGGDGISGERRADLQDELSGIWSSSRSEREMDECVVDHVVEEIDGELADAIIEDGRHDLGSSDERALDRLVRDATRDCERELGDDEDRRTPRVR